MDPERTLRPYDPYDPPPAAGARGYGSDRARYAAVSAPKSGPVPAPAPDARRLLSRAYIRWLRARWFGGGFAAGAITGIVLTVLASAMAITSIPRLAQLFTGEPDVSVIIGEPYLNREATRRINGAYPTDIPGLTLTAVNLDLKPDNLIVLQASFRAEVLFAQFDLQTTTRNQLSVRDGQLVISMVGDPQLGTLNVPLHLLPNDFNRSVTEAIDRVDNDLLVSEINRRLSAGFGGSDFAVTGVRTTETGLEVQLAERAP